MESPGSQAKRFPKGKAPFVPNIVYSIAKSFLDVNKNNAYNSSTIAGRGEKNLLHKRKHSIMLTR